MTEKNNTEKSKTGQKAYEKFGYAMAADQLLKAGKIDAARTGLNKIKFDTDLDIFWEATKYLENEDNIKGAIQIFNNQAMKDIQNEKLSNLSNVYKKEFDFLTNEGREEIKSIFSSHGEYTLGDAIKEYSKSAKEIESYNNEMKQYGESEISKDKIESAESIIKKYQDVVNIYSESHSNRIGEMIYLLETKTYRNNLESIVKNKTENKKKKESEKSESKDNN